MLNARYLCSVDPEAISDLLLLVVSVITAAAVFMIVHALYITKHYILALTTQ